MRVEAARCAVRDIPVGLFDGVDDFVLKRQTYIDEKPEYFCLANETDNFAGDELATADPVDVAPS